MGSCPRAAVEWTMKVQEVILRAMAKKITWWQAAEIIGITERQMRTYLIVLTVPVWHLSDYYFGCPTGDRVADSTVLL